MTIKTTSLICLLLTMAATIGTACCAPPKTPPAEEITLPPDVPLPPGFDLAPNDPVPKTNTEGVRFARYGNVSKSTFGMEQAKRFFMSELSGKGWAFLGEMKLDTKTWSGRWSKDKDVLQITYTDRERAEGDTRVSYSHVLIEINVPR